MRLIVLLLMGLGLSTAHPAVAGADPVPPSGGYDVFVDVADPGTEPAPPVPGVTWDCRSSEVRIASNGRHTIGTITYANIDATRWKYDSATGQAWVWTYEACVASDGTTPNRARTFWRLVTVADPALGIDPAYDRAIASIRDPNPVLSPVGPGIVNLGMWLAVDDQGPVVARANVTSAWAEVTARQSATTFDFGNGDSVTCMGVGTPIPESAKDSIDEGPCGYTYRSDDDGDPYLVTITSTWTITWELSNGLTGTRPDVTLTTTVPYHVIEIQTVGTGG